VVGVAVVVLYNSCSFCSLLLFVLLVEMKCFLIVELDPLLIIKNIIIIDLINIVFLPKLTFYMVKIFFCDSKFITKTIKTIIKIKIIVIKNTIETQLDTNSCI